MKVTNPKQPKLQHQHPLAEGKLNNFYRYKTWKKTGFSACLFLWFLVNAELLSAQQWVFDEKTREAYELAINLHTQEALQKIPEPKTTQEHYVVSLAQAVELLISEDAIKFQDYENQFKDRLEAKIKTPQQDYQFLMAELRLQWAFVYLKFGHEFDAGSQLREAYLTAEDCRSKYPRFQAIKKTTGLIDVIIGSVPEKYNWLLGLLGMQGSVPRGLASLDALRTTDDALAFEADLLFSLIHGFVLQKPEEGFREIRKVLDLRPDNRLALFLGASLAMKNSKSEEALALLTKLDSIKTGFPLYYADYLKGEIYLHKGQYLNALSSYRWFVNNYSGQNYIKDAYYKMALCYWLNGNTNDAYALFKEAKSKGRESAEADKSAARSLSEKKLPHILLSKVRYATDGGYYDDARMLLSGISDQNLSEKKDHVEFFYRKARLEHKAGNLEAAKLFYRQTIDMTGNENWYFAPNACLQLGYILESEKNVSEAKNFFQKALTYKKHEYKNSIDSKAKSAIGRLGA